MYVISCVNIYDAHRWANDDIIYSTDPNLERKWAWNIVKVSSSGHLNLYACKMSVTYNLYHCRLEERDQLYKVPPMCLVSLISSSVILTSHISLMHNKCRMICTGCWQAYQISWNQQMALIFMYQKTVLSLDFPGCARYGMCYLKCVNRRCTNCQSYPNGFILLFH